jgi:hypothetical protein
MKKVISVLIIGVAFFMQAANGQEKTQAKKDPIQYSFQFGDGVLKVSKSYVAFQTVSHVNPKIDTVHIWNVSEKELAISFMNNPEYIAVKAVPEKLSPDQKGMIITTIYPNKNKTPDGKQIWGAIRASIQVIINGDVESGRKNILNVSGTIEEDFAAYTKKQLKRAPKIVFDTLVYNYGNVKQGETITHDFSFINKGKEDLEIRSVKAG